MRVFVCLQVLKESTYVRYTLTAPVRSTEPSKLSSVNDAVFEIIIVAYFIMFAFKISDD